MGGPGPLSEEETGHVEGKLQMPVRAGKRARRLPCEELQLNPGGKLLCCPQNTFWNLTDYEVHGPGNHKLTLKDPDVQESYGNFVK